MMHTFILTRFALHLWTHDKHGEEMAWERWLEERFGLFERWCLPSLMGQTRQDFRWLLLVSDTLPDWAEERMRKCQERCPQICWIRVGDGMDNKDSRPVGFHAEGSHFGFARMFQRAVGRCLEELEAQGRLHAGDRCLTTYLDNDDELMPDFVERVQFWATRVKPGTFVSFDYGYQEFVEINLRTRIYYPNNHFITLVEEVNDSQIVSFSENQFIRFFDNQVPQFPKTCYGYGSHFLLEKRGAAPVFHVTDRRHPMWTEVIHGHNVDNDVKMTLDTKVVRGSIKSRCLFVVRALGQIWRRSMQT